MNKTKQNKQKRAAPEELQSLPRRMMCPPKRYIGVTVPEKQSRETLALGEVSRDGSFRLSNQNVCGLGRSRDGGGRHLVYLRNWKRPGLLSKETPEQE